MCLHLASDRPVDREIEDTSHVTGSHGRNTETSCEEGLNQVQGESLLSSTHFTLLENQQQHSTHSV